MSEFSESAMSLTVPEGWRVEEDPECTSIRSPDDIGVLQLSVTIKDSEVLESDLLESASEYLEAGALSDACRAGDFVGIETAFSDGIYSWRMWWLRNDRQMLYITYICAVEFRGIEDDVVDAALGSLVAESPTDE